MRDGKRIPVRLKALATPIESLPQGTLLDSGEPFPMRLVDLDEAKIQVLTDAVQRFEEDKWPRDKPWPSVKVRLEIHFQNKGSKDKILWRGTRTVRVVGEEGGPAAHDPEIRRASISPDGKSAAVVLVVADTWEPLFLRLDGK